MSSATVRDAMALARSGRPMDGVLQLREAQSRGDAEAFLLEGLWLVEGRFVPRDLAGAREKLAAAAELGQVGAARTLAGFVACGVGGTPDWTMAIALLESWADADPIATRQLELIGRMDLDATGRPARDIERRAVSADPRIERVDGLFTADECAFLVELSDPRMKRATIFHDVEQRFVEDPIRRSDKAGFPIISEWPFVRAINLRIAAATGTPVECGEPLQILRYGPSQEYRPHFDAIAGMENPRVLTALAWLNADYAGGETRFDDLGLSERGRAGDLLVFANTRSDETPDPRTLHSGAPVTSGVKYMGSRWIRARPAGPEGFGRHEVERS
jgi:prolyl 4-hydroxylase